MSAVLAVVPARGGSKGVPRKNLAPVAGKPLIAWTLECAAAARRLDRVVVSTDCEEIAAVARAWGGEVPFLRPAELARDETPGIEPILHALDRVEAEAGEGPEWVVCLQPTSPLRLPSDIDGAVELARRLRADSVVGVTPAPVHPAWMRRLAEDGRLAELVPGHPLPPSRQQLPPAHALNGAIYVARADFLRKHGSFHGGRCYGWPMPPERSVDVDTPFDLEMAAWLLARAAGEGAQRSRQPARTSS